MLFVKWRPNGSFYRDKKSRNRMVCIQHVNMHKFDWHSIKRTVDFDTLTKGRSKDIDYCDKSLFHQNRSSRN